MKEILLQGNNISKVFVEDGESTPILNQINVQIYKGDFTIIMGASGAGKSTLLYSLSGMDSITDGSVEYRGKKISGISEQEMARLRMNEFGFVFQQTHLVSNLTLFENIAVAGYVGGGRPKEVQKKAAELLEQMHVNGAKNRLPSQTSGGESQRAAIARAMINNPGLIFADEPTGALNKSNSEEVLNLLSALNEAGQSILMVTHDIWAAIRGTRILYMEDGTITSELTLPAYSTADIKEREEKVMQWLSSLQW